MVDHETRLTSPHQPLLTEHPLLMVLVALPAKVVPSTSAKALSFSKVRLCRA